MGTFGAKVDYKLLSVKMIIEYLVVYFPWNTIIIMYVMCFIFWYSVFVQFEYTLTCAICTKPQEKEMRVLSRISQVSLTSRLISIFPLTLFFGKMITINAHV